MNKILLMVIAAIMTISTNAQETVKKVRLYKGNDIVIEQNYDEIDSIVFVDVKKEERQFTGVWVIPDASGHVTRYFDFRNDGYFWDYNLSDPAYSYAYYLDETICQSEYSSVSSIIQGSFAYDAKTAILTCNGQEVGKMNWLSETEIECTGTSELCGRWYRAKGFKRFQDMGISSARLSDSISSQGNFYLEATNFTLGVKSNSVAGTYTEADFVPNYFSGINTVAFTKAHFVCVNNEDDTYNIEGIFLCENGSLYCAHIDTQYGSKYKPGDPQPIIDYNACSINGIVYDNKTDKCWKETFTCTLLGGITASEITYVWATEFNVKAAGELQAWNGAQTNGSTYSFYYELTPISDYESCVANNN